MMKMQMVNQFLFVGAMQLVSYFFPGFVATRLPFSLTERFRVLTQQGIGVPLLDTSFVSTSSWYFTARAFECARCCATRRARN